MYSIDNLTVGEYLEKLADPGFPGPASGSAAATTAATAAALLEMAFKITVNRDGKKVEMMNPLEHMEEIRKHCLFLATEDMRAFAEVIKASGSRGEFPDKYEAAMKNATDTLVAILKNCESILTEIEHVFKIAYPKVLGDLVGGACLAEAAAAAAKLGAEVNLGLIQDEEYRKRMLSFVRESYKSCVETKNRIVEGISV